MPSKESKASRVGRPRGPQPTKNAAAVRRYREKKEQEMQKLEDENASLKQENKTLIQKVQQQSDKIQDLERRLANLQPQVDPRGVQDNLASFFDMPEDRVFNRRQGGYPQLINVQHQGYAAPGPYSEFVDYGNYQNVLMD
ncbi:hypothetical protein QR680_006113 [Steinernema hermaphroditum]|uniref:BZIP domain-containing protein n=1 Tax=Steinernema hermaphroditum TaxID=289476 RepID=A0AA39LWU6_9BILA|nr:hypothetical protein QR680_006113 [Steinernema hermaphroditum]